MASKSTKNSNYETLVFPSDIMPADEVEREAWFKQWTDAAILFGQTNSTWRDNDNFLYAQGNIPETEFEHITKLYVNPSNPVLSKNYNKVLPAKIRQVNAIASMVQRVIGKADANDISFTAMAVNEDAVSQKLEELSAEAAEKLTRSMRQSANVSAILGVEAVEGDDVVYVPPQDIEAMSLNTYQQENEIQVNKGLKYLLKKQNNFLKYKLTHQGLYNYVVTGKMAFDTMIESGDPDAQSIDPRYLFHDNNSSSPFIQHGRFAGYYFNATPQEIIDRCPNMSDEDVEYIASISNHFIANTLSVFPKGFNNFYWIDREMKMLYLNCWKVYWAALKRVKVKISTNKFDEDNPHIHFVDEKATANEEKGEKIEYRYVKVICEATKVADRYYQPRELPNQTIPLDSPSDIPLPIIGIIDPMPCLVDLAKPIQNMRVQAFYAIERLVGQAKGKILIVDEAIEEHGQQNLYNMMAFGVYKVNTAKEGEQQLNMNNYVQPKEIDMGLSQAVNDLMRFIAFLDQNLYEITGINDAERGITKSDVSLGATTQALQQAQLTIQPFYTTFYTVVEMVLQQICNLMKPAWAGKPKTAYFMGDRGFEFLSLKPEDGWDLADYGIFVENAIKSNQLQTTMVNMASQVLPIQKDPEMALSVIKMIRASSAQEAENIFEKGISAMKVLREAEMAISQQQQEQLLASNQQVAQLNAQTKQADNATQLQEQQMIQDGEDRRLKMKMGHEEDKQTVEFQNNMAVKAAEKILETQQ